VPVNALLFRSEGLRAVTVDDNHKTHLQALTIGRDYGTTLEVLQGLKPTDWIVINPADSLDEGQQVNVKQMAQNAAPAPVSGGTGGSSGQGNPTNNPTRAPSANPGPGPNGSNNTNGANNGQGAPKNP
jgi:hypothetical protein